MTLSPAAQHVRPAQQLAPCFKFIQLNWSTRTFSGAGSMGKTWCNPNDHTQSYPDLTYPPAAGGIAATLITDIIALNGSGHVKPGFTQSLWTIDKNGNDISALGFFALSFNIYVLCGALFSVMPAIPITAAPICGFRGALAVTYIDTLAMTLGAQYLWLH